MRTPMHLDSLTDIASVSRHLAGRWRDGVRHPLLGREILEAFPAITVAEFNASAALAWASLDETERLEAVDAKP